MTFIKERYSKLKEQNLCVYCGKIQPSVGLLCNNCKCKQHISYMKRRTITIEQQRLKSYRIKQEVISHYGSKCIICGEKRLPCLQLDHINNNGKEHRLNLGVVTGGQFYAKLRQLKEFPAFLQILCANCHAIKNSKWQEV